MPVKHLRSLVVVVSVFAACAARTAFSQPEIFPQWAFPAANTEKVQNAPKQANTRRLELPGTDRTFSDDEIDDFYAAPDWFPDAHPLAPAIVLVGRKGALAACGYCHLPDGSGRPENASLSGLPADYIRRQVAAFRAGSRRSASPGYRPSALMAAVAANATDEEVASAANYFAAIGAPRHLHVVETDQISGSEEKGFLLRAVPGAGETLGDRIVEGPTDFERFERRDPSLSYTAFVPAGSVTKGAVLARTGGAGQTLTCSTCHGIGLRGGADAVGPPLAGRSPSYIFRQLYGFSVGARGGDASLPMRAVVAHLTQKEMIALAAYVGTLEP